MVFLFFIILLLMFVSLVMMMRHVKREVDFFSLDWNKGFYSLVLADSSRFNARGNLFRWLFIGSFLAFFIAAQFLD